MDNNAGLAKRLRVVRTHLGMTQEALAERIGVTLGTVNRYEMGGREPTVGFIQKLARLDKSLNPAWLLTGEGPQFSQNALATPMSETDSIALPEDFACVPFYEELEVSAGTGAIPFDWPEAVPLAFRLEWLKRDLRVSPADAFLFRVRGDSMVPTLHPNEIVLAKRADRMDLEGIYVLRLADAVVVKRCQPYPTERDGRPIVMVRVTSDNPAFAPFETPLHFPEVAVLGRAIWAWSGHQL